MCSSASSVDDMQGLKTPAAMDVEAVKAELDRLEAWQKRWLGLAQDRERMRARGNLQSVQERIMRRAVIAQGQRAILYRKLWSLLDKPTNQSAIVS